MSVINSFSKDNLHIRIYESREEMGQVAASDVAASIRSFLDKKEVVNIVFAAAPSQNEFLDALCREKGIEWNRVNGFHLDEYVNLSVDAPQRFGNYLRERIFSKLPFRSIHYLNKGSLSPEAECDRYTQLLQQYPLDIVCMGIGENGHIAFNDPHVADFKDPAIVKIVDLDETCRKQQVNDGCFRTIEEVPTHAYTLTIPALMSGARIFCVVPAQTKAWAIYHTIHDEISEALPATFLRNHKNAVLYADTDSMALLTSISNNNVELVTQS